VSQENVELVRSIYEGWLRDEAGLDKFDPDICMVESAAVPGAANVTGVEAVERYIASFARYWDEIRFEPQEYLDAGDRVVVVARLTGRGKSSGVVVNRVWAYVWTIRAGKALRMEAYSERSEALAVAGLSKER
jgi:ketosteroid isomerase-like protein